jgi:hypothetical protein
VVPVHATLDEARQAVALPGGVAVVVAAERGQAGEEVCVGILTAADLQ